LLSKILFCAWREIELNNKRRKVNEDIENEGIYKIMQKKEFGEFGSLLLLR